MASPEWYRQAVEPPGVDPAEARASQKACSKVPHVTQNTHETAFRPLPDTGAGPLGRVPTKSRTDGTSHLLRIEAGVTWHGV